MSGTIWHALDAFTEAMKVTNHTGMRGIKLAGYSLSVTHHICLYGLENNVRIHDLRPVFA